MPRVPEAELVQAFITPIRFALLVDDKYPVYSKLVESENSQGNTKGLDASRAAKLFKFCRSNGWLCDVDNAADPSVETDRVLNLHQSDLLVLDYHLDPAREEDPAIALDILQKLAKSDHFNLVVVYTAATPKDVVREMAFSLGGGANVAKRETAARHLEELSDPDRVSRALNEKVIDRFLASGKPDGSASPVREELRKQGVVDGHVQQDIINLLCEEHMTSRVTKRIASSRQTGKVVGSFAADGPDFWISQGNLFAVVVSKNDEPTVFIERLKSALCAWDPPVLHVMLTHARAALEKAGRLSDDVVLDTPARQAGWFLRVLCAKDERQRKECISDLYSRVFSKLVGGVLAPISEFGAKLIPAVTSDKRVVCAKEMADGAAKLTEVQIYHALNEYLCAAQCADGSITTGVIFRAPTRKGLSYWVCTSPACDLVPGQKMRGWDGELHPLRSIAAARLVVIREQKSIEKLLKSATNGRHFFVFDGVNPIALEVSDEESRQMKLEVMFLETEGEISSGKMTGHLVVSGESGPVLAPTEFTVVGMLRPDYANRVLAESGFQRSRIGVDYINLGLTFEEVNKPE